MHLISILFLILLVVAVSLFVGRVTILFKPFFFRLERPFRAIGTFLLATGILTGLETEGSFTGLGILMMIAGIGFSFYGFLTDR